MSSLSLIKSQKYDEIKSRENIPLPQKVSVLKIREKYSKQETNLSHHQSIKACLTYLYIKPDSIKLIIDVHTRTGLSVTLTACFRHDWPNSSHLAFT